MNKNNLIVVILLIIIIVFLAYLTFKPKGTLNVSPVSVVTPNGQTTTVNNPNGNEYQPVTNQVTSNKINSSATSSTKTYALVPTPSDQFDNPNDRNPSALADAKIQAPNFAGHYVIFMTSGMGWEASYLYDKNTNTVYGLPKEVNDDTYDAVKLDNYSVSSNTFTIQKYDSNNNTYTQKWELTANGLIKL